MIKALETFYLLYPNKQLNEELFEEWFVFFEPFEKSKFIQAFRAAAIETMGFAPTPAQVMKEIRAGGVEATQTKEWIDYPNGSVSMKITTSTTDEKGKPKTEVRTYVDTSTAEKWAYRKRMFKQGCWLCIESKGDKQMIYSFMKWPPKQSSSMFIEGGYHQREGEQLPFLVRQ